jgi:hypothetical protein
VGEPAASLDTDGISLHPALVSGSDAASWNAHERIGFTP